jgi:integrase
LTLAEARARARKLVDQAKEGIDPATAGAERRAQQRNTVAAVAEEYAERHLRRNLRSGRATERRLQREIVGAWGGRPIRSITRADVVRLVDGIADRGAGVMANRTLQIAGRFFTWAVKRSILEVSPATGVDLPHRERPRERVLAEAEIRAVWRAFETMGWPFGRLGQLLLLTAARRAEAAGMRWAEIDPVSTIWTIPAGRVKSGREHSLPLAPLALAILKACPRVEGSPLVFPSSRADAGAVSGFSGALARIHELSGTSGWTWHDLRRTARSGMARLGILPHVAERVLNHAVGSQIERIYDLHRYLGELHRALTTWSAEVERIVGGEQETIVALRAG